MTSKTLANGILRAVGILILSALSIYIVYQISTVFVYLIVSLVLALIASPIVKFFKRKLKFNNTVAVVITLLLFILLLIGFILLFVPLLINQVDKLSLLDIDSLKQNYTTVINQLTEYFSRYNLDLSKTLDSETMVKKIDFNFVPNLINGIVNTLGNFSVGLVSVIFITFFLLKDKAYYFRSFKSLLPNSNKDKIVDSVRKSNDLLSRYFIGLMLQLLIVFILYLIVLLIFGVDNAFIIALLCAILNIIPYVGPIISTVLAALLTMISNIQGDFSTEIIPTTIYVVIGFFLVQFIDNNFSQPIIFSKSTDSHPLQIFLVILIAGYLFGITGMIIAVPLYTVLKVIAKEFFPNNTFVKLLTKTQ
jgi:predicted PurR-regulated permease PerM